MISESVYFPHFFWYKHLTLIGMEFDAVILWKPDAENYKNTPEDAKLLYVAITRALHELHLMLDGEISDLLRK